MLTRNMIRDLVGYYLAHPRHHNPGLERLLFVLVNWFIYAVQVYERGWLSEMILAEIDKADDLQIKQHLKSIIDAIQAKEYIIEVNEKIEL